jgi:transcriptional regulator
MYIPKHFEEPDLGVLHALIKEHPFGAWVTTVDGALEVNHIPFLIDPAKGKFGTLVGHVARANPIWKSFSTTAESLVIFQGPQCYITPSWYQTKQETGKVVPTWNYALVHAYGTPRAIEDKDWLRGLVTALTDSQESKRAAPWAVTDAPADYVDAMLKAIVGIEIPLANIVGKWKTSQNRTLPDKQGTIAGLTGRGNENSNAMAVLVQRHTTGD